METRRNNGKTWHSKETGEKISRAKKGKFMGPLSSRWQDGLSRFPYSLDFNEELKALIRKRDGYTCQLCNRMQRRFEREFDVHHIDYIKKNLNLINLITLCRSCNAMVNLNRVMWTKFFQQVLKLKEA